VSGAVLLPGDDGYDDARRVHNGMIDRRPALIVRCRSASDAAAAVRFARAAGAEISVRGGGHNVGGLAVADGAVMVDLAEMKSATVDPEAGVVTAQGGLLNRAANIGGNNVDPMSFTIVAGVDKCPGCIAINAAGEISPAEQVSVRPEINGKIEVLPVDIGDRTRRIVEERASGAVQMAHLRKELSHLARTRA